MTKALKIQTNTISCLILVIMTILLIIPSFTYATIDPNDYKPNGISATDVTKVKKVTNPIIGTLKVLGIVVAVITLAVLGIKYMMGSVSEKAEYKKTMIPYLIGATMVVAITQFLSVIIKIVTNIK